MASRDSFAFVRLDSSRRISAMGLLKTSLFTENKFRPCLQAYYADWAPEKLGELDSTLAKFEGREKQLFAKLQKKYGKKANLDGCTKGS